MPDSEKQDSPTTPRDESDSEPPTKKTRREDSCSDDDNDKKKREPKEREKEGKSGKGRDKDRDKSQERGREKQKDKRRRDYEGGFERDPPANFERYWGSGPKRTSHRDRGSRRNYDRDYDDDHEYERFRRRDHDSGKVGPRYYGGKRDEEDGNDTRKSSKEDKKDPSGSAEADKSKEETEVANKRPERKVVDMLTSKTGGAYIPPARLRMMQAQITDKSSAAYQRLAWEALKKSIHGHINKVNTGNLATVIRELLKENLVRGCGLLCRSILQAQAASPTFTRVFAALVAVINSRFPQIGELLVKRVVINFKRGFRRQDKASCISSAIFVAHLVNQSVAHELLALEILVLLVENPTSDSVEVAIAFLKEVVDKLLEVAKKGTMAIQDMLRNILHEGTLDKRVQYIIETMFQIIKVGGSRKLNDEQKQKEDEELLSLVEEEDQITHILNLDDAVDPQNILDVFKEDSQYEENEASYKKLLHEILGSDSESGEEGSDEEESEEDDDEESGDEKKADTIIDNTETNLVALRRTIYLTIQSSLDFEECAHKLMRMQLKPGQENEMCHMILDCCAEMRTYEKFFGLLAQRFCMINKLYITPFQHIFIDSFATVHRLEINKLRNVAKFFAHLLHTDAISWEVLSTCRLTEEDSTSSSRIFIKILFQELSEYMGLPKLNARVKDPTLQLAFEGLFPRDDPKNTRFAINFFTSIGLGGLTDELREHLKSQPRTPAVPLPIQKAVETSSSSSSSESSSSSSSSDSSSSDSEDERENRKKKKTKSKGKQTQELGKDAKKKSKASEGKGRENSSERYDQRNNKEQRGIFDKSQKNFSGKEGGLDMGDRHVEREPRRERERRDFDNTDRRGANKFDHQDPERVERRDFERVERRDFERVERRDFERAERKDSDRLERRGAERVTGNRNDMARESRRDEDLEEHKRSRKERRPYDDEESALKEQRKETNFEARKNSRKERRPYDDEESALKEQRKEIDFEAKKNLRKERRPYDDEESALKEQRKEIDFEAKKNLRKERRPYDEGEKDSRDQRRGDEFEGRKGSWKEGRPETDRHRESDRDYEKEKPRRSEKDRHENGDRIRHREKERHHR